MTQSAHPSLKGRSVRLIHVEFKDFRSIQNAALPNCGGFNVLIGKNNSGKANILSGLATIFRCLGSRQVISLGPEVIQDLDYYAKSTTTPIGFRLTFALDTPEQELLIADIANEAKQFSNLLDGIGPGVMLSVSLTITPKPTSFAYVSAISMSTTAEDPFREGKTHNLLEVDENAAKELFDKNNQLSRIERDLAAIDRVGQDILEYWKRFDRESRATQIRYMLERPGRAGRSQIRPGSDIDRLVDSILDGDETIDDVKESVSGYQGKLMHDLEMLQNEELKSTVRTFAGEETTIPAYVSSLLDRLASIEVLHLREQREGIGADEARRLLDLKVRRGGEQRLLNIRETVSALLGVRIDAYEGAQATGFDVLRGSAAELDVDDFLVQANGAGIREALRIVLDYEFKKPSILLVEEPEIHLHPALEIAMMTYLKRISDDCQVFITTHSTNFLDTADMRNVYLIHQDGATDVEQVDYSIAETAIPRELGMRLSSFFMFERLVFVEGPTDEAILREFATSLRTNLGQSNVGFVTMGGARKFAYFANESSLSFLAKRRVKIWFVLDRDQGQDDELAQYFDRLGSNGKLKVLSRREIENYLVDAQALSAFIKFKRSLTSSGSVEAPPEDAVQTSIESNIEGQKELVISKIVASRVCRPVFPALRNLLEADQGAESEAKLTGELKRMRDDIDAQSANVAAVFDQVRSEIEMKWASDSLSLVQGDILLDAVCRDFGVRFSKEVDGSKLASFIAASKVPTEISALLRDITV